MQFMQARHPRSHRHPRTTRTRQTTKDRRGGKPAAIPQIRQRLRPVLPPHPGTSPHRKPSRPFPTRPSGTSQRSSRRSRRATAPDHRHTRWHRRLGNRPTPQTPGLDAQRHSSPIHERIALPTAEPRRCCLPEHSTPLLIDAARPCQRRVGVRWFVDATYVKVAGKWRYVYRAIDEHGQVIDVWLGRSRP